MQKHSFHLVDPSPWPIYASFCFLGLTSGLVGWFNNYAFADVQILISLLALIYTSIVWWRDVLRESVYCGHHTKAVQKNIFYGFILFVISEVMLFAGFFWAWFHYSLAPTVDIACVFPPRGIEVFNPFGLPFLNTLILLTSGASVTWAHYAILLGQNKDTKISLAITIVLAIIFTAFQAFEYLTGGFNVSDSVYGSCFYMLTGLHGLHVIVGTIFLSVCLFRTLKYELRPDHHLGFELAALYWHFVDVVWLFLFIIVYWWGS